MSKDKGKITRKRFVKLTAKNADVQVQTVRDMVFRILVDPGKRKQEQRNREKHRRGVEGLD